MKRLVSMIRNKTGLVLAIAAGIVVGGAGSAIVMASVPDSNGVIHACYTTGLLAKVKIIDSPSQSCNANETAITWNQKGPKGDTGAPGPQGPPGQGVGLAAYAHVRMSSDGVASLDTARSYNVTDIHFESPYVCLTTPVNPKTISAIKGNSGGGNPTVNDIAFKDSNGWSRNPDGGAPLICDQISPTANVGFAVPVPTNGQTFFDSFVDIY